MALKPLCFSKVRQVCANDPLKKVVEVGGVKVGVEWPAGTVRKYKDGYQKLMKADYGYIRGTEGEDGEEVDVYVGPNPQSTRVFKLTQLDKKTGKLDEYKFMLGYESDGAAKASYLEHMEPSQFGGIEELSQEDFMKLVPQSQRVHAAVY